MSDLHYAPKTLDEVERCVTFAVDHLLTSDVDAVVISGDATDHSLDAHSPALLALLRQVSRLAQKVPVLMLQGTFSHQPPGLLRIVELMRARYPVYVADRIGQVVLCLDGRWQCAKAACLAHDELPSDARCVISCLPTVNRAVIQASSLPRERAATVTEALNDVLRGFGVVNDQLRSLGIPTLAVAHGTVTGCITEHGVPMAGPDHEFGVATLFAARASAFLLGHIHRHQSWEEDGRTIAYAGSPARLHFGEEGEKGFLIWDIDADQASFEFIPTPACRMLHFDFAGMPDMATLKRNQEVSQGARVRIRWRVTEEARRTVNQQALLDLFAGAAAVKLEERIEPIVRARAAGIAETGSLSGKLERWAEVTQVNAQPLVHRLQSILGQEPQDILLQILDDLELGDHRKKEGAHDAQEVAP